MSGFTPRHEIVKVKPRACIIVVSNSRFRMYLETGQVEDESGNLAKKLLQDAGIETLNILYLPNCKEAVKEIVKFLVDNLGVNVIITIGGTGLSYRDQTVDAIREIAHREIPGFGELFRRLSESELGPHIILTRASAFTYNRCVIFCLPGSPSAVKLAIEKIILPTLEHVLSELHR